MIKIASHRPTVGHNLSRAMLAIFMLMTSIISIRAANPYHVTLTTSNFSLHILSASAEDLSDPTHARFSLQNGTPLWYGITVQSNPSGMVPTSANGSSDLVTTTFSGSIPLLPPAGVLPFDQANGSFHYEALKLAVAFSGPNQQIQLNLSPFEPHAITLDMFTLLLQLLGQKNSGVQIGLLAPNSLQEISNASSTMKDFGSLTNDYIQVLQAAPDTTAMLTHAYDWSKDLVALLTDAGEQKILADLLWKILGKTIPYLAILKTINSFVGAQFALGMEGFIRDESLIISSLLIQQNNPTVTLQSITITPRPSPTPTSKPSPASTPLPAPTAPPRNIPTPTPRVTRKPTPKPTHIPTATPTK